MVDKNISAECLKPELWTHLQEILDLYCPPVKILHILQKAEGLRAVTQNGEKVMLDSKSLEQPKGLLEAFPAIDEVRIYTEAAMDCYDKKLQAEEVYDWDIDEYLEYQYRALEETDGIQVIRRSDFPRHIFQPLKKWIQEDGTYLLWVTNQGKLYFNCILVVRENKIKILTTSGRYGDDWEDLEKVKKNLEKEFYDLSCHVIIKDGNFCQ